MGEAYADGCIFAKAAWYLPPMQKRRDLAARLWASVTSRGLKRWRFGPGPNPHSAGHLTGLIIMTI